MNYEHLVTVLEQDDDDTLRQNLYEYVLTPCVNGKDDFSLEYHINDDLDVSHGFVKADLLSIYSFIVIRMGEMSYEVYVRAQYVDTLSTADGGFAKIRAIVAIDGEVSPKISTFEGNVYTTTIETV